MNIAITGEGIVSAIGLNKDEVLKSLRERRTGIAPMHYLQSVHDNLPVGEVKLSNTQMKEMLGLPGDKEKSRTTLMGIMAVRQAVKEARLQHLARPLRVVLISGTTVGGMDITENHFANMMKGEDAEYLKQHDCGSCTDEIAADGQLFNDAVTISTACSSAANAMVLGANMIKAGEADIVVAGGTEALSRFHLNGFNSLMILDKELCRPFDETRAGLNLGEGAAYVVMESDALARERGAQIHAYLTGYGNRCDAFHQTASSENGEGATLAMQEALDMAGIKPTDIQYVNAHGTGTPDNDKSESAALRRIFGDSMPPVSSTKGFTGHTTSASGAIETVICMLSMRAHFIPANQNWSNQMSDGIRPTMGEETATLENVLCNSFGFGGNDTSLVLSMKPRYKDGSEGIEYPATGKPKVLSRVEISSTDELKAINKFLKPMETRRMGKLMKGALLSSLEALELAGVECPDAIITGTGFGCLENSERLLQQIEQEKEATISPTFFMQSTHNTISSAIAIKTKCHGYNMTYTQGADSLKWAVRDAELLLRSGRYKTVLVGCHDESAPIFKDLYEKATGRQLPDISSMAMVLTTDNA